MDQKGKWREQLGATVGGWFIMGGVGVFGWQVYRWLRFAQWEPVSAISALQWMSVEWARYPSEWWGVWKILDWLPLAPTLIALGCLIVFAALND